MSKPETPQPKLSATEDPNQPGPTGNVQFLKDQAQQGFELLVNKPEVGTAVLNAMGRVAVEGGNAVKLAGTGGPMATVVGAVKFGAAVHREAKSFAHAGKDTPEGSVVAHLKQAGAAVATTEFAHAKPGFVARAKHIGKGLQFGGKAATLLERQIDKDPKVQRVNASQH